MDDKLTKKTLGRRSFFSKFGKGILGASFLSLLPFKSFAKEEIVIEKIETPKSSMKVKINPLAVVRRKK